MKLKKSMVVTAYLLPVALLALASTLTAVTVDAAANLASAQYKLPTFTAVSTLWLLILAGCLAIVASSPRVSRVIIFVIGLLAAFELFSIISKILSFPTWLSDSIFSSGDEAQLQMLPWLIASLGLVLTLVISILALRSSKTWQSTRKYDRAQAPSANPWAAIDHGVDPTMD
jgi:hypothetical protein